MNILIIGDNCTDIFIRGDAKRICPEAPVAVLNPTRKELNAGMAGNVYENVRSLRPESRVFFIRQESEIVKTRYVDEASGYILLRVDENDSIKTPFSKENLWKRLGDFGLALPDFSIALISDYNKGFLSQEVISEIVSLLNESGVPVFMDTKKILGEWSKGVDFVKINEKEYNENLKHIRPMDCCRNLIVTLGSAGSIWRNNNIQVPSDKVEVMDVSGAGDTYFAAFAISYFETKDVVRAMSYANKAAAIAVSKRGVVAVKQSEI